MPNQAKVMTIQAFADHLEVGRKTVQSLRQLGLLPGFLAEGLWRFQRNDIERWAHDPMNRRLRPKAR